MEELMSTRLPKKNLYEKKDLYGIAKNCDMFVHNNQILNISEKNPPRFIFISAYLGKITIPFFINRVLSKLVSPVIIIIASEDYTFPNGDKDSRGNVYKNIQKEVYDIINHSLVEKIYVENLDRTHPKLHPIPLGIHPIDNLKYLELYMPLQMEIDLSHFRRYDVFCNHRIRIFDQFKDREKVANLCKTVWKPFVHLQDNLNMADFKNTLLQSTFVICVHGGGIDPSPRAWEALLCGCIPIIQSTTLNEAYSNFPVIFIDEWNSDAITEDKIEKWKIEYSYVKNTEVRKSIINKLKLSYWWNKISALD